MINRRTIYSVILTLLLIFSIHGYHWVPFWNFRGLDFLNLFAFHRNCASWPIRYGPWGARCGDPLFREMLYPPMAYWAMAWTRLFDFKTANAIWEIAIPTLTFLGMMIVSAADKNPLRRTDWIAGLFFFQMPMVYAIERGNIDALVVPMYAAAIAFFAKRHWTTAGFFFAAACWLKVYPVVPVGLLLIALFSDRIAYREYGWPFLRGFAIGGAILGIVFLPDSYRYIFEVLPRLMADPGGFGTSSHTLYGGRSGLFLKIPVFVLWTYLTRKMLSRDPVFILTAGLAISTFFPNLTNDYNLITSYPFLFLLLRRLLRARMSTMDFAMLILTCWAFVGDRTPLEILLPNRSALFLQIVWIIGFPAYLLNRIDKSAWPDGNLPYDEKSIYHRN